MRQVTTLAHNYGHSNVLRLFQHVHFVLNMEKDVLVTGLVQCPHSYLNICNVDATLLCVDR